MPDSKQRMPDIQIEVGRDRPSDTKPNEESSLKVRATAHDERASKA